MILRIVMWMFISAIIIGGIDRTLEYLEHSLQKCIENCGEMDIRIEEMLERFKEEELRARKQ